MKPLKSAAQTILFPLTVMLLLTLLVGLTTYEVTLSWQQSAEKSAQNAVGAVMLTNIRWELSQAQQELATQPQAARHRWEQVRQQVNLLAQLKSNEPNIMMLQGFMAKPTNLQHIDSVLTQDFLNIKLSETETNLNRMREHSHFVTTTVILCMLALGGVLMGITAWDLNRLLQALIRSRDLNIRLQEEERRRIAQDLHDGVVQELIDLKRHYTPDKVDTLIHNLRRVCQNLKPQVLDDLGLAAALELLADELRQAGVAQVQVTLDTEGLSQLPKAYELPIFRVVQELFSNIKNHAQASQATLTIAYQPLESPVLSGSVSDNGQGFSPDKIRNGMGLSGVQERIQQVGGRLESHSQPGQGSRFQFFIPIHTQLPTGSAPHAPFS